MKICKIINPRSRDIEGNILETQKTQFLLEEYRDLYQNVMHLESKLFNHLSFFTTLFLGIMTASVAIVQLSVNKSIPLVTLLAFMPLPFGLLFLVGRFEIRMTTELRIRKMRFIEGIVKIREYFVVKNPSLASFIILPSKLDKAPRYLRIGSQDWYQLLYLCLMNMISFLVTWTCLLFSLITLIKFLFQNQCYIPVLILILLEVVGIILTVWIFWKLSYLNVMDICKDYDQDRERRMGKPIDYDLLERSMPKSRIEWTFSDWIRFLDRKHK